MVINGMRNIDKPIHRSPARRRVGQVWYSLRRYGLWLRMAGHFARTRQAEPLPCVVFTHHTPLMRKLRDVDMWMQRNKVVNLRLAASRVDGIVIRPGETFSYWRLIGSPSKRKGYLPGMLLRDGQVVSGTGGGLCQLSNLIFWMAVHTPLTLAERHRHGYDVFPDSGRTQPFGSGATCFYPHGDLMLRNDTPNTWQIRVWVGEQQLEGEIRCDVPLSRRYEIVERNHCIGNTFWGGYYRHNELYQQVFDAQDRLLEEKRIVENNAIMMYSPMLDRGDDNSFIYEEGE